MLPCKRQRELKATVKGKMIESLEIMAHSRTLSQLGVYYLFRSESPCGPPYFYLTLPIPDLLQYLSFYSSLFPINNVQRCDTAPSNPPPQLHHGVMA